MGKLCRTALALALLAGPAHAQGESKDPTMLKFEKEEKDRKEIERQYNEQMKRLKQQAPPQTKADPWSGVRSTTDSSKR